MRDLIILTAALTEKGSVESNIVASEDKIIEIIKAQKKELVTDADFKDADELVKWCRTTEDNLKNALAEFRKGTGDIDTFCSTAERIIKSVRSTRLDQGKQIRTKKEQKKKTLLSNALHEVDLFLSDKAKEIRFRTFPYMSPHRQIEDSIKSKSSFKLMGEALDSKVEEIKEEIEGIRENIKENAIFLSKREIPSLFKGDRESLLCMPYENLEREVELRELHYQDDLRKKDEEQKRLKEEREAELEKQAKLTQDAKSQEEDFRREADIGGAAQTQQEQPETSSKPSANDADNSITYGGRLGGKTYKKDVYRPIQPPPENLADAQDQAEPFQADLSIKRYIVSFNSTEAQAFKIKDQALLVGEDVRLSLAKV